MLRFIRLVSSKPDARLNFVYVRVAVCATFHQNGTRWNDDNSGYVSRGDHNFLHWRFPLFVSCVVSNLRHGPSLCIHLAWAVRPDRLCPYSGTESNAMTGGNVSWFRHLHLTGWQDFKSTFFTGFRAQLGTLDYTLVRITGE